jgi:hypothetical protein
VGYDPARDILVAHEPSAAEQHILARRVQQLTDAARDATVTPNPYPRISRLGWTQPGAVRWN